jgi:hypothetical protein
MDYPFVGFAVTLVALWVSSLVGYWLRKTTRKVEQASSEDVKFVLGGALTLLGLIIGFTFSMAVGRYDQRKNLEEEEANAIGTEYTRAALMTDADAANVRSLLKSYLAVRIDNYRSRIEREVRQIDAKTAEMQTRMMSAVVGPAKADRTQIMALVVSGMNDVLNSQGYTQAAWRNRVPIEAWVLMGAISVFCNLMIGYCAQGRSPYVVLVLPIVVAISVYLIADIDGPRSGFIRVDPVNLDSLAESLR